MEESVAGVDSSLCAIVVSVVFVLLMSGGLTLVLDEVFLGLVIPDVVLPMVCYYVIMWLRGMYD